MRLKLLMAVLLVSSFFTLKADSPPVMLTITGDATACTGEVYSYSVPNDPSVFYEWTIVNGAFVSSPIGSNSVDVAWYDSGSITVSTYSDPGLTMLVNTGSLSVSVDVLDPYITFDPEVGCLDIKGEQSDKDRFENDCIKACEDNPIRYLSNGNAGSTFTWQVIGDANIMVNTSAVLQVSWQSVGFGVVILTETSANGCVEETEICVEIIPKPIALFDVEPGLTVCVDQTVYFEDLSQAVGDADLTAWEWKVSDGTFQSYTESTDFTHVFTSGGSYSVALTVYNTCGCFDTYEVEIEVIEEPGPDIFCPKVVCPNEKTELSTSSDCGVYLWAVENGTIINGLGTQTITVMWDDTPDGVGVVELLTPCGECNIPTRLEIPIVGTTLDIEGPIEVCQGDQVTLVAPSIPGTFYTWSTATPFSNAFIAETANNQVIIQVNGTTPFTVELEYFNELAGCGDGCGGQVVHTIIPVTPSWVVGVTEVCVGDTESYNISGPATGNILIEKPDGTTTTMSNGGNYTFTTDGLHVLTPNNAGCLGPPLLVNAFAIPPVADVINGPTEICPGIPYTYEAGNDLDGTIYGWSITGGTPSTGSGKEIPVTWNPTGPYKVEVQRINIKSPNCASDFIELDVDPLTISPTLSGETLPCANESYGYTLNYTDGEEYRWKIIPQVKGSVITDPNSNSVQVQWNNTSGPAAVIAGVRKCNQWFSDTLMVNINPALNVSFTASDMVICEGETVNFNATGGFASYSWNITPTVGGPLPSSANVSEQFNDPGTFSVSLAATDACGNISVDSKVITVLPEPPSQLSATNNTLVCSSGVVVSGSVTLVTSVIGGTTGFSFSWTRNSVPLAFTTPVITVNNTGLYEVTVTDTTTGCTAVEQLNIVCPTGPGCTMPAGNNGSFEYAYDNTTCGEVDFTETSANVAAGWTLASRQYIHLGTNAFTAPGPNFTYSSFDDAGIYNVNYRLCYSHSSLPTCCFTASEDVIIPIVAEAEASAYCDGSGVYQVQLNDFSSVISNLPSPGYTATWVVDGTPLAPITGFSGTTTVPLSSLGLAPGGTYTVVLKVDVPMYGGMPTDYECEISTTLNVPALPDASFMSVQPVCEDLDVLFTAAANPPNSNYFWNFGDGSTLIQTVNTASRKYNGPAAAPGYIVNLTVTNSAGCTDTGIDTVNVVTNDFSNPVVNVAPSGAICQPNPATLTFSHSGTATATSFDWSDGATGNPNTVFEAGGYAVTATDAFGCITVSDLTPVDIRPAPSAVIFGESEYCEADGLPVVLSGYAGPGFTYQWEKKQSGGSFFPFSTSAEITDNAVFSSNSPYEYRLTVTDPLTSCTAVTVKTVIIHPNPPQPNISDNILNCDPYEMELTANTTVSPATFNWSNGQTGNPITVNHGGLYEVTLTDSNGCRSVGAADVEGEPNLDFFPVGCYEFCPEDQPWNFAGPYGPFDNWELIRNGSTYASGSGFISNLQIMDDGEYYLVVEVNGCTYKTGIMQVKFNEEKCEQFCDEPCEVKIGNIFPEQIQDCLYEFNADIFLGPCTNVIDYSWTINGMSVPGGAIMSYVFPGPGGSYKICLNVTAEDDFGKKCEDKICIDFKPTCKCDCDVTADFEIFQNGCDFEFIGTPTSSKCTKIVKHIWRFYDQKGNQIEMITDQSFGYSFDTKKPVKVCYWVIGTDGESTCEDEICTTVFPCIDGSSAKGGDSDAANREDLDTQLPSITVSPNPVFDRLRIDSQGAIGKEWHLRIIDATGRVMSNTNLEMKESYLIISTDGWTNGIYHLSILDELGNRFSKKIVKVE